MDYFAEYKNFDLHVFRDVYADSPRESCDNFGIIAFVNKRYNTADKDRDYQNVYDFFANLYYENINGEYMASAIKNNQIENLRIVQDESDNEMYNLQVCDNESGEWYTEAVSCSDLLEDIQDDILDTAFGVLSEAEIVNIIEENIYILPVYVHSYPCFKLDVMPSPDSDSEIADGFIYASFERIRDNFGKMSVETMNKVKDALLKELADVSDYYNGNVYGFELIKDGASFISQYGIVGEFEKVKEELKEVIPKDYWEVLNRLAPYEHENEEVYNRQYINEDYVLEEDIER